MHAPFLHIFQALSAGDSSAVESFFSKPGGRKYLENITLILIHTLPHSYSEKKELYRHFVAALDQMEKGIRAEKGQAILDQVFRKDG